jgi:hypothetical protein
MTRDEQLDLRLLLELFLDYKREDSRWKERLDERVGAVEDYVIAQRAVRLSRREKIGIGIAAVSALGGVLVGLLNALT